MNIRQILRLTLFLPFILYIFISISYDTDRLISESYDNKFIIDNFRLDKSKELIFHISNKTWPFKCKLDNELLLLSIEFDNPSPYIGQSDLIFKVSAYTKNRNKILNRLILHDYINNSDTTILKKCNISSGRYRIGLLCNFIYEDIVVKMDVIQADSILNQSNPRLVLESYKASNEIYGFGILNVYLKKFLLIISILCFIIYVWIGIKTENKI